MAEKNRKISMNAIYDRFEETGRFSALRCGWTCGELPVADGSIYCVNYPSAV